MTAHPPKIATCCYCGTRAALVLSGTERHELTCGQCGAPLHDMKRLQTAKASPAPHTPAPRRKSHKDLGLRDFKPMTKKPKKKKKKYKSFAKSLWDVIDDIID